MAPFGGWEMPISYASGTIAEHMACRTTAAMFDVSHLGTVVLETGNAFDDLQRTLTNDLGKIAPGRTQYTHLLNRDGGVVDDIIIWWVSEHNIQVMPNASNTDGVLNALNGGRDITNERAIIAVQGPTARATVSKVAPDVVRIKRRTVAEIQCAGVNCTVAGTGYTGEDGVELAVPAGDAPRVWDSLLEAGVTPAGLGARDTLRLEAGLPLHGHELGPTISPLEAGLGWVVAWDKAQFVGREALLSQRENGVQRTLVGVATVGRRPPRDGSTIEVNGEQVGMVTSGNYSPVLGHGIALGFVAPQQTTGPCEIRVRDTVLSGSFVPLPFVAHRG